jgi:purine-cytosine permease-like protein
MGYIIRIAVAELGLLLGVLAIFLTGTLVPALTGLGLFLVALLMLYLGLNQIPDS